MEEIPGQVIHRLDYSAVCYLPVPDNNLDIWQCKYGYLVWIRSMVLHVTTAKPEELAKQYISSSSTLSSNYVYSPVPQFANDDTRLLAFIQEETDMAIKKRQMDRYIAWLIKAINRMALMWMFGGSLRCWATSGDVLAGHFILCFAHDSKINQCTHTYTISMASDAKMTLRRGLSYMPLDAPQFRGIITAPASMVLSPTKRHALVPTSVPPIPIPATPPSPSSPSVSLSASSTSKTHGDTHSDAHSDTSSDDVPMSDGNKW